MSQSDIMKRIESICNEFDNRVKVVGLAIARLELAKALAESEANQQGVQADDGVARLAEKWMEDADQVENDGERLAAHMLRECAEEFRAALSAAKGYPRPD